MKPLDACQVAMAHTGGESALRSRINAFEWAGARVRPCILSQDLWSTLSEAAFDLIVVLLEQDDVAALAMYRQLREHPRTRSMPTLLLSNAAARDANVLARDVSDDVLIAAAADRVTPWRLVREAEVRERELREQLQGELSRADASARDLAELSHELRSMLDGMLGFACNLRDELPGPLLPDQRSHVAGILEGVERATKLLGRATTPSQRPAAATRLSSPSAPPRAQRTLVPLARLAAEVSAWFEPVAARKSQRLQCVCDETVFVWGDQLKLKQVVTNLTVNALKYTPEGGEIKVRVGWSNPSSGSGPQARKSAEIVVTDTGPGIRAEYRERVFERGFRIDRDSAITGEGIGLAVVKDIITQHGGFVRVDGDGGSGAVFKVSLPQDRRQRARSADLTRDLTSDEMGE
jgi:signal transduction histidine kinase